MLLDLHIVKIIFRLAIQKQMILKSLGELKKLILLK